MLYGKGRMTRSNEGGEIIKQDERGRMRVTRERREALLVEFDRSAMTGRQFAAWAGIKHSTFANWQRLRRKGACPALPAPEAQQVNSPRWLEAVVDATGRPEPAVGSGAGLIVQGPGGLRLELSREEQVPLAVRLLRELGWKPGC
jgi:hypothetical protein